MSDRFLAGYKKTVDNLLYSPWGSKATQIALLLCCFALPILLLPLAWHESGTELWVRVGLPKNVVKQVLIPGGMVPLQYALVPDKGVYRSTDNGITWVAANNGLPSDRWGNIRVQALAVDEGNPFVVYAGMGGVGSRDHALSAGLYLTDDGGATWLALGRDMAGKEVQAIAVSPASAIVVGKVCIAASGEIYCSEDKGQSWLRLGWRGGEVKILSLAIRSDNPDAIYVGTEGYGLYVTENGGTSWEELNRGLDDFNIYDIVISGSDPNVMYLATNGGVYKSMDAGLTWTTVDGATKGRQVNVVVVHPQDSNILYAGLQWGAAYCSIDGGKHWKPIKRGLGNLTILSLAVDPRNSSLWAGTTDGIWRYVFEEVEPLTPTNIATVVSATSEPTQVVTLQPSATPSPSKLPVLLTTLTPTATITASPTVTHTPKPSPTRTLTLTPALTATAEPIFPTLAPATPVKTLVPR